MIAKELEKPNQASSETEAIKPPEIQGEVRELDEAALEQAVEQAEAQIDSEEKRVLDNAEKEVAPPPSLAVEQFKANSIFENGGFSQRIDAVKNKIANLAQSTKERVTAIVGSQPEVIHFSEMANASPKAEAIPATEMASPESVAAEIAESKTKQVERAAAETVAVASSEAVAPKTPEEPKEEKAPPKESAEKKTESPRPMSLDQYMAQRGRSEKFSDRMREKMQIAQLKLHRVKDPERVLGLAHYLEDNAVNEEVEHITVDKNKAGEIEKTTERYKKQGYEVDAHKSYSDEQKIEIWAKKETPFKFEAKGYVTNNLSELVNSPNDPVSAFERLHDLGYRLETYKGGVTNMGYEMKTLLQTPNVLPFLEKLKTFGGANVSHDFFNGREGFKSDEFRALSEFATDDAKEHLLTEDAEKKIERISAVLGRPINSGQLEEWLRLPNGEHTLDIVAAFAKGRKIENDRDVGGLIFSVGAIQRAGIEDVAATLLKDGFPTEELTGIETFNGIDEAKVKNLRDATSAFEANPKLLEAVRQGDNVFARSYNEGVLTPENLQRFSRIVETIPDAGTAFATLAELGVRAQSYEGSYYLDNPDRMAAHKEVLETIAQPDFKTFATLCEKAGYQFNFKDFFSESEYSRTSIIDAYKDEKFRAALSSENGIALAQHLGVFESPSSQWNRTALDYLAEVPDAIATLQKLESGYGFQYNVKDDYGNYKLQSLWHILNNEELRSKLLDQKTVDTFSHIKNEFGISLEMSKAGHMIEIADNPKFQEMMRDPETIAFVKTCLKKSNTDIESLGALLECNPTMRPAIEKMATNFDYAPEGKYFYSYAYDQQTGESPLIKELLLTDGVKLAELRDDPKIFEAQERLAALGVQKNPLEDIGSLKKINEHNLFHIFEQTKASPQIQDFLWRNLDTAASLAKMSPEKIPTYIEIFQKIDDSPSQEIQRLKPQLLSQLLESERPVEDYQQIESIFIKNNIPTVGKVFNVFETLYDKKRLDGILDNSTRSSPVLERASSRRRYYTVYQDLLNVHIESGNRSLKEYVKVLKGGSDVLDRFERSGIESLAPREQEQLKYFVGKLEKLLAKSALDTSEEAFQMADNTDFGERIKHVREGLKVADGQTVLERISEMYLRPAGMENLDQILEKMREAKTAADGRGRAMVAEAMRQSADGKAMLKIQEGDLLKGVDERYISNILQNGSVAGEFLGASSDSDATPLDTDVSIVLAGDLEKGNQSAIDNSLAQNYGKLMFVLKDHGRFQRTEQGSDAKPEAGKRELFKTGVLGERHYGIRTGFGTTEIDFMVAREVVDGLATNSQRQEQLFFEIAQNGYYIPIVNESGEVIFTPEMYDERRKAFEGLEKFDGEALPFKPTTPDEPSYGAVTEIATALPEDSEKVKEATQMIRNEIQQALGGLGVALRPEFDTSILGAELLDTGSTGRHTNTPGDFDFDFSLKLDAKDFTKASELAAAIKGLMKMEQDDSHEDQGGYYQLRAKGVTEIGGQKLEKPLDIDIGFAKKSDLSVYGSHDAIRDKLNFIKKQDGDEAYQQTIANIVLTKQVLKEGHAYKKVDHGGIGGIGVENWVLANGGNMEVAFKNFRDVAYDNGARLPFEEFKRRYKILDAGVNIKYLGHDNFVDILKLQGYEAMLNTIDGYLAEQKEQAAVAA